MPFHGRPFQKGNLYIHFQVVFPDRIDPAMVGGALSGFHHLPPQLVVLP